VNDITSAAAAREYFFEWFPRRLDQDGFGAAPRCGNGREITARTTTNDDDAAGSDGRRHRDEQYVAHRRRDAEWLSAAL